MRLAAVLFIGLPALAQAWDAAGHMLVTELAWTQCTPKVRQSVRELVVGLDNRFNAGHQYNFVTVGCWMDDLRSLPRAEYPWGKLHYVDGPKTADGREFKVPEPPHIISAIADDLKLLRDPATPREARAKAVGMLMHWIGDIHQPLHATTWDDQGGNGYAIVGVPFTDLIPQVRSNLHTYWDKSFRFGAKEGKIVELWTSPKVDDRPASPGEGVIAEQALKLLKQFPRESLPELAQKGDAEAWARESHILGCTKGYPAGDHPRDTEVRKLEPEFVQGNQEIAARRIAVAGYRLADVLNELFP